MINMHADKGLEKVIRPSCEAVVQCFAPLLPSGVDQASGLTSSSLSFTTYKMDLCLKDVERTELNKESI